MPNSGLRAVERLHLRLGGLAELLEGFAVEAEGIVLDESPADAAELVVSVTTTA